MKEGLLIILKVFAFFLALPLVFATVLAFQTQTLGLPVHKEEWFLWGALIFTLVYLFLYDFKEVYTFGQNLLRVPVIGLIVPVFTLAAVLVCFILNIVGVGPQSEQWMLFALGFTVAFHLVLTARQLFEADSSRLKSHYLFTFSAALVASLFIIALVLNLAITEFSFVSFVRTLAHHVSSYYHAIYKFLFVAS